MPVGPTMPRLISSHKLSEVSAPPHPTAWVEVVLGLPRHATARTRVHSRVGRRAGASDHIFEDRFRWWREVQRGRLVHLWRAERDRALARRHARAPRGAEDPQVRQARCLERAKTLIEDGELSRACRLLHDTGMAPLTPGVVDQLRRKHPPRRMPMPAELPGVFSRVTVSLTETFRKLRRRRGPSGMRNEYLRALVAHFDNPRANQMMPRYDAYTQFSESIRHLAGERRAPFLVLLALRLFSPRSLGQGGGARAWRRPRCAAGGGVGEVGLCACAPSLAPCTPRPQPCSPTITGAPSGGRGRAWRSGTWTSSIPHARRAGLPTRAA